MENVRNRLIGERFRAYVHDVRAVHATVETAGFRQRFARRDWYWLALVYERAVTPQCQSPS